MDRALTHPDRQGPSTSSGLIWWVRSRVMAAVELALPATCGVCGGVGAPLCARCRESLSECTFDEPHAVALGPHPHELRACWSGGSYEGVLAAAVVSFKDRDRRDLARTLLEVLEPAVVEAFEHVTAPDRHSVVLVPAPSSARARRVRGDQPVSTLAQLAHAATQGMSDGVADVLRVRRAVADQSGLRASERRANVAGAMCVPRRRTHAVAGRACILIDDVITTGATAAESARALFAAGATDVVAATVSSAALRYGP